MKYVDKTQIDVTFLNRHFLLHKRRLRIRKIDFRKKTALIFMYLSINMIYQIEFILSAGIKLHLLINIVLKDQ